MKLFSDYNVMIGIQPIDFRAGMNRLSAVAQTVFKKDPRSQVLFVFRNKQRTAIKFICYDGTGYFVGHKRLSRGKLKWWPRSEQEALSVKSSKLIRLLHGVDPRGDFHPDWKALIDSGQVRQESIDAKQRRYQSPARSCPQQQTCRPGHRYSSDGPANFCNPSQPS